MNLVEIATIIQEAYKQYYSQILPEEKEGWLPPCKKEFLLGYVMRKTRGHQNPKIIEQLIELETSIPDNHGRVLV